jgi:NADPH2:quinone reductase
LAAEALFSKMRAVIVDEKAPGRLALGEVDEPKQAANQALVRLAATSLNRGEVRRAQTAEAGYRPGWDVAGTVERQAADGSGPKTGTRVVGLMVNGAWAELVAVRSDWLAPLPEDVSFAEAATLPVAGLTAYYAIEKYGSLLGRNVLVTGASGGVGHLAVQLVNLAGGRAVGVVRQSKYASMVREAGAYQVVASEDASPAQNYAPYDLVIDGVGGSTLANCVRMLAPYGMAVTYGGTAGREITIPIGWDFGSGGASLYGLRVFMEAAREPGSLGLNRLAGLVAEGRLRAHIAVQVSWKEIGAQAQRLLGRSFPGKAVMLVD